MVHIKIDGRRGEHSVRHKHGRARAGRLRRRRKGGCRHLPAGRGPVVEPKKLERQRVRGDIRLVDRQARARRLHRRRQGRHRVLAAVERHLVILRSEDQSFYAFPFGNSTDKPAPADFDGDGKFDAAVFRPSDTNWYILKSTGGVQIQQFGAANDIPLPGFRAIKRGSCEPLFFPPCVPLN